MIAFETWRAARFAAGASPPGPDPDVERNDGALAGRREFPVDRRARRADP
jgi:hypothetical protein